MLEAHADQTVERAALLRELRETMARESDPTVRESLQRAIAALESAEGALDAPEARRRIGSALRAAGLTAEPPEGAPQLTENAKVVLSRRYLLKDERGEPAETPEGMLWRVARAIADADRLYPDDLPNASNSNGAAGSSRIGDAEVMDARVEATAQSFYRAMSRLWFLPNSPTMMNAGSGAGTLSACFVLPLEDSMTDIMQAATDIAMVQKFGGGTGVALSRLRPKGASISTTHGRACGPIAVLQHLSSVSTMITQGGKRDGANMAVMDVHHPDISEFITCKHQEGLITNYNISVGATDDFMQAVRDGGPIDVKDPTTGETLRQRDARDLFEQIVEGAWRNGEPGMVFLDTINRSHPTPQLGRISATNPCGEQPLLPNESCNLGSINLARMLRDTPDGAEIAWDRLAETVTMAVHFLDNVIDANQYSVPAIERVTKLTRKIGLGVMGFADMLVRLGIPYDSDEGLATARDVMGFISHEADAASSALAETRGTFPAFKGSRLDHPGAPPMRNACRLTVAPTGTISMVAGCSSGVEPIFALAFRKHNILEGQTLFYIDEAFEAVSRNEGFYSDELTDWLSEGNSLQATADVPGWTKRVFVTAPVIAPEWHVRMQAAFQEHTDSAISKTINFPNEATVEDVRRTYDLSWDLGCKGITVYRAGSREKEVLTAGTVTREGTDSPEAAGHLVPRQRPQSVRGMTERIRTGHGTMYVTINVDDDGRPFEVFTALGKGGSSDSAQLEAVSRLISMALRAGVDPESIISQLRGITDDPVWDSGVLVRSAPDAVALALSRAVGGEGPSPYGAQFALFKRDAVDRGTTGTVAVADGPTEGGVSGWGRCPECSGPLVSQEGCLMCRECGYNKCG